jgi:1,2-diacylglycerol 3-alpha-glucosyltransferase
MDLLLYSAGLGYIQRGLETFTQELYETLSDFKEVEVTLFQGRGSQLEGAIPVWAPKRNSKIYDYRPFSSLKPKSYRIENLVFSIPILTHCYTQPCDIVHFSENLPANILYHLRNRLGGSFKLLFSNGGPASPEHYQRYDYVQVLTPAQKQEAIASGYPEDQLFLVPYGLDCKRFSQPSGKEPVLAKRRRRSLPVDRQIILSVGAINSSHKRMDWLIREFATLDPERFFLWVVGQPEAETREIEELAKALLQPHSYRFEVIPYAQMPEVYTCADYFVLCSLGEGFGRVYIEAMAAGLPVIAHRNINTEWLLGSRNLGLVDMTQLGQVKDRILYLQRNFSECQAQGTFNQNDVLGRFDWTTLANQYLDMYKSISNI